MEPLIIQGLSHFPDIIFNPESGILEISGESNPENAIESYKPVIEWLDEYIKSPSERTIVNVKLQYYNTSSSKCILNVLRRFETLFESDKLISINWFYEKGDEDGFDAARDYESLIEAPFNIIETVGMMK
jgi:hypothetical protein